MEARDLSGLGFQAVYIDGRELRCAWDGGGSNVPLGFVSPTGNPMTVALALGMGIGAPW